MKQLSSMDLHFLCREFNALLSNQRIDNFYFQDGTFYIRIYVSGKGHHYLTNKVSKFIYIGTEKDDSLHPNSFIAHLRKYLRNGFIRFIEQVPNERIFKVAIEKKIEDKIETFYLVLELFAGGNIILCDNEMKIKNALERKNFKDRSIKVKDIYELPPSKDINPHNVDIKKFKMDFENAGLSIVKFLAIKLGMGGKFAEEICLLSNVDKNLNKIDELDFNIIKKNIEEIFDKDIDAFLVLDDINKNPQDFFPFEFKSSSMNIIKKCDSFNTAVKEYFENFKEEKKNDTTLFDKELKKLNNRLDKQLQQKEDILFESENFNEIGNKIYENYSLIDDLLVSINKAAKDKGWDYVIDKIKNDVRLSKLVKKINYKNNEIEIEL